MATPAEGSIAIVVEGASVELAITSPGHTSVAVLDVEQAVELLDELQGACIEAWENRLRLGDPHGGTANDD